MEAIVAIAILGTAIIAAVAMVSQSVHAVETAHLADRRTQSAERALERAVVMNRAELVARIGVTQLSGWTLHIDRPTPTLFLLAIAETATGAVQLRTAAYRKEAPGASP